MKKNVVRIVAALLVAMLALTLIPMGAFALTMNVISEGYGNHPTYEEWVYGDTNRLWYQDEGFVHGDVSVTIKASNYDSYIVMPDGTDYDLKGIANPKADTEWDDKIPTASSLTYKASSYENADYIPTAWLVYTPHQHALTCWISDGTTHWKNCTVCKAKFVGQNWCSDGDEDGICNVCGGDVPYHDVTVIEEEGGKIIVNRDNACHRMKITADVEPAEGYKLKKLHFTKIRDDGSEQEITRYKKNGQFWTYMPTYELEVSAEFVKK